MGRAIRVFMGGLTVSKFEEQYKMRMEVKNLKKRQLMKLIEKSKMRAQEIAATLEINKSSIYQYLRELEELGCVKIYKAVVPNENGIGGNPNIFVEFVTWDKYKDQEVNSGNKLKPLPFDETLSRMMGYTDLNPQGATQVKKLDEPYKAEPLRKMNYGWLGYQSGLEAV